MRACRPRNGIIPFHEFSQSFKASRVTFRAFLKFSVFRHLKLIQLLIVIIVISSLSADR